jgi:predicted Zn-dependent protease
MCQQCVDNGEMTQEQWNDAKSKLGVSPDLFGALEGLFGRASAKVEEAKMDRAVRTLLELVSRYTVAMEASGLDTVDPNNQAVTADTLAMQLHYDQTPQALAYALGVIALRYQDLLDRWADLYVMGARDGRWAIEMKVWTPEAQKAVTQATEGS